MQPDIAIISHRAFEPSVSWEPIYEIEDMLLHYCGAAVADAKQLRSWPIAKSLQTRNGLDQQVQNLINAAPILLVIARGPADLNVINSIKHVRERFPRIFGYVADSYFHDGFGRATSRYDHVFVTGAEDVGFVKGTYDVSSSVLRQGIDTVRWHSDRMDRCIDVVGFGRTPESYHRALQARFHKGGSRFLYLHSPLGSTAGSEVRTERPMFIQLLRRSNICLAFHMFVEPVGNRPRSMMVTSRWLEALASGCIVVGRRPLGEMADDMLGWPNATFELSPNAEHAVDQIQELLSDAAALDRQRRVNLIEVRKRHDIRWRTRELLSVMGVSLPEDLLADLSSL